MTLFFVTNGIRDHASGHRRRRSPKVHIWPSSSDVHRRPPPPEVRGRPPPSEVRIWPRPLEVRIWPPQLQVRILPPPSEALPRQPLPEVCQRSTAAIRGSFPHDGVDIVEPAKRATRARQWAPLRAARSPLLDILDDAFKEYSSTVFTHDVGLARSSRI